MIQAGLSIWLESPIFGHGPGYFRLTLDSASILTPIRSRSLSALGFLGPPLLWAMWAATKGALLSLVNHNTRDRRWRPGSCSCWARCCFRKSVRWWFLVTCANMGSYSASRPRELSPPQGDRSPESVSGRDIATWCGGRNATPSTIRSLSAWTHLASPGTVSRPAEFKAKTPAA